MMETTQNNKLLTKAAYLLNIPFLFGLMLLLFNDHLFKELFSNWFTGKISDVAGVFILPFFLKFLLGRSNRFAIIATIFLFSFWKSPLSSFFIEAVNSLEWISIARIIDYTDLLAFLILPLSYFVLENIPSFSLNMRTPIRQKYAMNLLFGITVLSFMATSQVDPELDEDVKFNSCCSWAVSIDTVGNGIFFVPNIFTPNNDGVNDFFQIVADTGIAKIDSMTIRNPVSDKIVFQRNNIVDFSPSTGWDGLDNDTIRTAQYYYAFWLTSTDDKHKQVAGYICSMACNDTTTMPYPQNYRNCVFATQYDPVNHTFDRNLPSGESLDCLE